MEEKLFQSWKKNNSSLGRKPIPVMEEKLFQLWKTDA